MRLFSNPIIRTVSVTEAAGPAGAALGVDVAVLVVVSIVVAVAIIEMSLD